MAWEEALVPVSRPAGADLSDWNTHKYTVVKLDANGNVIKVTGVADVAYGVLLNDPKLGQAARVGIDGIVKLRLGGTVAAGARVGFNTNGTGKAAVAADRVIGVAVYGGVTGDIIPVQVSFGAQPIFQ